MQKKTKKYITALCGVVSQCVYVCHIFWHNIIIQRKINTYVLCQPLIFINIDSL